MVLHITPVVPVRQPEQASVISSRKGHADYLCEGIEVAQNAPEISRRFAVVIRRAEGWTLASAQAHPDDPRLVSRE
jgi:hypothetical protein